MPDVARIGDPWVGVCLVHGPRTGEIITGSPDHFSGGPAVARIGDTVRATCGDTSPIVTGSSTNFTNGKGKAHVGSTTTGILKGQITAGNPNHITG
ncbi:MAG: hypothetical protein DRI84_04350 [Bacteroidetes bacterium]|nr:MAG: hypothetical protein DRI84_04350 [Bacteroidota bacterium]